MKLEIPLQDELAPEVAVAEEVVRRPGYGRYLEAFAPGATFVHPRGLTVYRALAQSFATTFMQANPLYLNEAYARAHGFDGLPLSPLMVLNVALSLGVQNVSEKAIAHLGYYDVAFPRPAYGGDTLTSETTVLSRRFRGTDGHGRPRPGIVRVRTEGFNQRGETVVRYERAILIPAREAPPEGEGEQSVPDDGAGPPAHALSLPLSRPETVAPRTGDGTYFEALSEGEIIVHANGRTVTEEHMTWAYRLGNTHPLHYDRVYCAARTGPLSGEPVVYGGLVFAWLEGLASRDTGENALWDLGYTEGYHTQPVVAGDTVYPVSRVLRKEDGPQEAGAGIVTLQLVGVKNISGEEALARYGAALFQKELDKARDERLPEKVFEIERRLLVKKATVWGR